MLMVYIVIGRHRKDWQAQKKTCRLKYIENSSNMDFLVLLVGSCESERVGMVIIINKVNKEDC